MPTTHAIGIDLGTTYCAVARIDEAGRSVMIRNYQSDVLTPSVALFDDDEILIGRDAKRSLLTAPDRGAVDVKRDLGRLTTSRLVRGSELPVEAIQACILRRLGVDAFATLPGASKFVLSVPGHFDTARRRAVWHAGQIAAGLPILGLVGEPAAAALALAEQLGYLDPAGLHAAADEGARVRPGRRKARRCTGGTERWQRPGPGGRCRHATGRARLGRAACRLRCC